MVNYAQAKVYRLVNNVDGKEYVGSTCNPLHKRKAGHKRDATKSPNQPVYSHLNTIGWENVDIILIENYPCSSKEELHARERHWIETLKPVLNQAIPTRTPKERYQANKQEITQKMAQKYQANKAKFSQKYQTNKDLILQQRKKYYASQKEKILLQKKQYYIDKKAVRENRLFILEFQNITIV